MCLYNLRLRAHFFYFKFKLLFIKIKKMTSKYYNIEEIRKKHAVDNNKFYHNLLFKFKLFRKLNNLYFNRTPESDSLYRRRNSLIILTASVSFYLYTQKGI